METPIADIIIKWYHSHEKVSDMGYCFLLTPEDFHKLEIELQCMQYTSIRHWLNCNGLYQLQVSADFQAAPISVWMEKLNEESTTPKEVPVAEAEPHISPELYTRLEYLGIIPNDVNSHNEGNSNYNDGTHVITPWAIWADYPELTSWDHDIIKRVLRTKKDAGYSPKQHRILDYKKIIHNCKERIRQLEMEPDD